MLSLATIPLLLSFAAPDLGPYRLEPWNDVRPSWFDPLLESLKPEGTATIIGERRLPDGTLSGRDTIRTELGPSGRHEKAVWWTYGTETRHSTREMWAKTRTSEIDSMVKEYFRGDSTTSWFENGKKAFPGGELGWMNHGPKSASKQEIDSTFKYFDAKGRTVATRTILHNFQSDGTGGFVAVPGTIRGDSITWSDEGEPVRWSSYDSSKFLASSAFKVRRETHDLTWDGFRLVRDSIRIWERSSGGDTTRDSSTIELEWDGPRLLSSAEWDSNGHPLVGFGQTTSMWAWDSLGRMIRHREWGSEVDLDTLVYGRGPWPESRRIYSCANTEAFDVDPVTFKLTPTKDDCELEEIVSYTYVVSGSSGVGSRAAMRAKVRLDRGSVVLSGLDPDARDAVLADPSGRILSRSPVQGGRASLRIPSRGGIAVWSVLDGSDRRTSSGTVVVPGHR